MKLPWWLPFGGVPEIDARELQKRLNGDDRPQVVDVRTAREWRSSRIAGTVNTPVTELQASLPSLALDRRRLVVAICLSGHRSIPAVRLLRANGFDACQLQKGMLAWWREGLPVEQGDGTPGVRPAAAGSRRGQ